MVSKLQIDSASNRSVQSPRSKLKRSRLQSHFVPVSLFAWGENSDGQLGLGRSITARDNNLAAVPTRLPDEDANVSALCGGDRHSLLLRQDGCVRACGSDNFAQLGGAGGCRPSEGGATCCYRFSQVTSLESKKIVCVAAGGHHSLAVDEDGQVYAWGRNHRGQLGRDEGANGIDSSASAAAAAAGGGGGCGVRLVRHLSNHRVVQVSAGQSHSLALTQQHRLFAFGDNSRGQLGQGHFKQPGTVGACQQVASLDGLPIRLIACGGHHCLALSHTGVLFAWGANDKGQLGCGSTENQAWPVLCKTLRGQHIRHVACGKEHSAALTADGGVFTFGSDESGQLGHGARAAGNSCIEVLPRRVAELMGSAVTQLACGHRHTLAYVPATGRIYAFGQAVRGQLGIGEHQDGACNLAEPRRIPSAVKGPWVPVSGSGQFIEGRRLSVEGLDERQTPLVLYACGDASFLKAAPAPLRQDAPHGPDDFRLERPSWLSASLEPLRLDACMQSIAAAVATAASQRRLGDAAQCLASYNCAFLRRPLAGAPSKADHGVDLDDAAKLLKEWSKGISRDAEDALLSGLIALLNELGHRRNYPDVECLRFFLVAPLLYLFARLDLYEQVHSSFAQCVTQLDPVPTRVLTGWLAKLPTRHFAYLLRTFKAVAPHVLALPAHTTRAGALAKERGLIGCMRIMRLLHSANGDRGDSALVRSSFYLPELNGKVDIEKDYILWVQHKGQTDHFSFCDYPFVFDGVAKTKLLRADAQLKMHQAVQQAQTRNLFSAMTMGGGMVNPVLLLQVRRDNIVGDAISHLSKFPPEELRKPLRVHFVNEEAQDEGGVSKEFFQLIFREILDPLYGMFRSYESRLIWFNFVSLEDASLFHLIGILCGLAIYNSFLAGVAFPLAMYKKLLNRQPTLDDLKELDPTVGRNLQQLLETESPEDVDSLMLTFEIEVDYYGELRKQPLSDRPDEPVVMANRQRYVEAYVNYTFNTGCKESYAAFHDGFHKVCGGHLLALFEPAELRAMLIGEEDHFDWAELQKNAEYLGVYFANHEVIINFWSVFHHDFTEQQKRKFLHFLTGCDRVPMQGMSAVKIRIQPVHGGASYLPVAHTCYNLLDLPVYPDRDTLRRKLTQAIEQTEGFALV